MPIKTIRKINSLFQSIPISFKKTYAVFYNTIFTIILIGLLGLAIKSFSGEQVIISAESYKNIIWMVSFQILTTFLGLMIILYIIMCFFDIVIMLSYLSILIFTLCFIESLFPNLLTIVNWNVSTSLSPFVALVCLSLTILELYIINKTKNKRKIYKIIVAKFIKEISELSEWRKYLKVKKND